jgi:hypothetical protein
MCHKANMKPTRRDYCQFLLSTHINYTKTYMADHHQYFSHDALNRYLLDDKVSPAVVWRAVKDSIRYTQNACLIFDDTVLDKRHSFKMELVRRQYSGNEHVIVKGVVNCLYANPDTVEYWVIDWRVYKPRRGRQDQARTPARDVRQRHRTQATAVPRRADGLLARRQGGHAAHRPGEQNLVLPAQVQPPGGRQRRQGTLLARQRTGLGPATGHCAGSS